jgi:hypothetical protein
MPRPLEARFFFWGKLSLDFYFEKTLATKDKGGFLFKIA